MPWGILLYFGRPQEVEWAIAQEQLWILQSRPQTALPAHLARVSPFPVDWEDDVAHDFWQLMEYSRDEQPLPLEHDTMRVREYGIPTVIHVRHATRRLADGEHDGEQVLVDGTDGVVIRSGSYSTAGRRAVLHRRFVVELTETIN